jgi:hypothetical protein
MNKDTLFTIVFVVIIILFQLFGSVLSRLVKRDRQTSGKTGGTGGAGRVLQTLKSRVSREIQMAMEQAAASRKGAEWTNIAEKTPARPRKASLSQAPMKRGVPGKPATGAVASSEEEDLINEIRQGLLAEDEDVSTPVVKEDEGVVTELKAGYTVEELRQAVIWTEIFAPPLALRD